MLASALVNMQCIQVELQSNNAPEISSSWSAQPSAVHITNAHASTHKFFFFLETGQQYEYKAKK